VDGGWWTVDGEERVNGGWWTVDGEDRLAAFVLLTVQRSPSTLSFLSPVPCPLSPTIGRGEPSRTTGSAVSWAGARWVVAGTGVAGAVPTARHSSACTQEVPSPSQKVKPRCKCARRMDILMNSWAGFSCASPEIWIRAPPSLAVFGPACSPSGLCVSSPCRLERERRSRLGPGRSRSEIQSPVPAGSEAIPAPHRTALAPIMTDNSGIRGR
jgi:hypothetical protein